MDAEAVIPSKSNRKKITIPYDVGIYKQRSQIERCFERLKHFRRSTICYHRRTINSTASSISLLP